MSGGSGDIEIFETSADMVTETRCNETVVVDLPIYQCSSNHNTYLITRIVSSSIKEYKWDDDDSKYVSNRNLAINRSVLSKPLSSGSDVNVVEICTSSASVVYQVHAVATINTIKLTIDPYYEYCSSYTTNKPYTNFSISVEVMGF